MNINSRYPVGHKLPPGGSGERAGNYLNQGHGLSPLLQREATTPNYSLNHAFRIRQRYGLDFSTDRSTSPLQTVAYLTLTDFHEVSRAAGPKWTAMVVPTATIRSGRKKRVCGYAVYRSIGRTWTQNDVNFSLTDVVGQPKMTAMSGVGATVYLLWFVRERTEGEDIELLIGVYETEAAALAAIDRVKNKPGFVDFPDGFEVCPYEVGQDSWTEGFKVTD